MILIVTNKADYTADFLILELYERGIEFIRFNTEDFPTKCSIDLAIHSSGIVGAITCDGRRVEMTDLLSVWYRRPVSSIPHADITDEVAREFVISESQETLSGFWKVIKSFWALVIVLAKKANTRLNETRNLGRRRAFLGGSAG